VSLELIGELKEILLVLVSFFNLGVLKVIEGDPELLNIAIVGPNSCIFEGLPQGEVVICLLLISSVLLPCNSKLFQIFMQL